MDSLVFHFVGEISALTSAILWAFASVLFALVIKRVSPIELNLLKDTIGLILVGLTLLIQKASFVTVEPLAFWLLLLSGVIGISIGDTAYFRSLEHLGARRALLVGILAPPITGVIAMIFLRENLSIIAWGGILITVMGIAWVITERTADVVSRPFDLRKGVMFGLTAALCQAGSSVLSRAALTQTTISPMQSTLLRLVAGIVFLLIWIVFKKHPVGKWIRTPDAGKLWGMAISATFIATYLGMWLQQIALKFSPAGIVQTLFSTSPIFVLPIAWLMKEKISIRALLGVILSLAGIVMLFSP